MFPSSKTPCGGLPDHLALPLTLRSVAVLATPINEYLDQLFPCSADSNKNVPGFSFANALYKPTGVNESPIKRRTTGITFLVSANPLKSARDGFVSPIL